MRGRVRFGVQLSRLILLPVMCFNDMVYLPYVCSSSSSCTSLPFGLLSKTSLVLTPTNVTTDGALAALKALLPVVGEYVGSAICDALDGFFTTAGARSSGNGCKLMF